MHTFSLRTLIRELRTEPEYLNYGRCGMTLVKNGDLRVLIEVLRPGGGLPPHRAPGPITFQVLEGEIRFTAGDQVAHLRAGEFLTLPAGEHHVEAITESAFLLTIAIPGE